MHNRNRAPRLSLHAGHASRTSSCVCVRACILSLSKPRVCTMHALVHRASCVRVHSSAYATHLPSNTCARACSTHTHRTPLVHTHTHACMHPLPPAFLCTVLVHVHYIVHMPSCSRLARPSDALRLHPALGLVVLGTALLLLLAPLRLRLVVLRRLARLRSRAVHVPYA